MGLTDHVDIEQLPDGVCYTFAPKAGHWRGWVIVGLGVVVVVFSVYSVLSWLAVFPSSNNIWETLLRLAWTWIFAVPPLAVVLLFLGLGELFGSTSSIKLERNRLYSIKKIGPWRSKRSCSLQSLTRLLLSPSPNSRKAMGELFADCNRKRSMCLVQGFHDDVLRAVALDLVDRCNIIIDQTMISRHGDHIYLCDPGAEAI